MWILTYDFNPVVIVKCRHGEMLERSYVQAGAENIPAVSSEGSCVVAVESAMMGLPSAKGFKT